MFVSTPVLIASFAFINQPQRQHQWRHRSRSSVSRELHEHPNALASNTHGQGVCCECEPRQRLLHHPTSLSASSSSSPSSSSNRDGTNNDASDGSSVSTHKPSNLASKNEGKTSSSVTGEEDNANVAATATKVAKVTRIAGKTGPNTSRDGGDSTSIQGLLPSKSFSLFCHVHCTISLLRMHFPTLLELPALSSSTAKWIYDPNVTVTGPGGEQLAEGLDEVLLLNRALATAATAARRAGSLFDLAVGGTTASATGSSASSSNRVQCELIVDPINPLEVLVLWRTRLPSIGSPFGNNQANPNTKNSEGVSSPSTSYTEFSGKSTVDLCPDTGVVTNLQIQEVKINGVALIDSLGTALAAVRRTARTALATSSIFDDANGVGSNGERRSSGNPLLDGLLSGIQSGLKDVVDAVDALPSSEEKNIILESPLYVVPKHMWKGAKYPVEDGIVLNSTAESVDQNATFNTDNESSEQHSTYIPVPADQYSKSGQIPLVGSEAFVEYATSHRSLHNFAKFGLYQLAGIPTIDSEEDIDSDITTEKVRSLFTTDIEFVSIGSTSVDDDYITLLRGAGKVADLYRSLAIFRETSGGDWKIKSLEADLDTRRVVVNWRSESPVQIEGTDIFVLEAPSATASYRLPLSSDGDKDEIALRCSSFFNEESDANISLKISRIENLRLTVAGVSPDSAWAQSFVSAALRSGITENTPLPDGTITELLRALTKKKKTPSKSIPKKEKPKVDAMPILDDAAAVSFYGIIRSLHSDLSNIATTGSSSAYAPAGEFLAENVELRGLLGEVLGRGSQNYRRLLSVAISSLRAAIQTKSVRLAAQPRPTVEVTAKGSIKVNMILALWVAPGLPLGGPVQSRDNSNQGFGVPLKIELSSEYIVDKAGKIREHRILESRLNGVLTPGDLFSRWIRGLTREESEGSSKSAPSAMESVMDAITWVRSMQDRK